MSKQIDYTPDAGHCTWCGKKLNPNRTTWLNLSSRTGRYYAEQVPESEDQGWLEFGADCAKSYLKSSRP